MTILFVDIETLPTTDASVIADISSTIKAPGQYKKQESINEWMATEGKKAAADAVVMTSFDGLYGSIACICYAFDDGDVFSVDANTNSSEAGMIATFYAHVLEETSIEYHGGFTTKDLIVCGHNVAGFDLPFLKHRSIIHSIKPVPPILNAMKAKPWESCVADTMLMWSSDSKKRVGMNKLCRALGLDGKGDFDGSMVAETWAVDPQKVISYCRDDVERTRGIYKRMTWADA